MAKFTFRRWLFWMIVLLTGLAGVGIVAVSLGAVSIPLPQTWKIIAHSFFPFSGGADFTASESSIILEVRVPRVISGMLVGASLAIAGAVLQALLRNPLADPFVLGISSGAAVGAVLAILLGFGTTLLGSYAIPGAAFAGSLLTLFLVYAVARVESRIPTQTMLLAGVIVSSFFSAVIMFLISFTSDERLHDVIFWLMGNLEYISSRALAVIFSLLLGGSIVLFSLARDLNIMSLGEETASELGVEVERVKKIAFIFASLIVGAVVSMSGLIGFVGLVVPHIVRMIWGPDHRFLLPASALVGAMLLVLADTVARTVMAPAEIPVGVVTAMGGAPFFIYLLRKKAQGVYD
jgi:iron complex transport system permease protein